MEMQEYIDEIKLILTGGVLELEIPDTTLEKVVNKALREIQRYIDTTQYITIPFSRCIDLKGSGIDASTITNVFRTQGYDSDNDKGYNDPMYMQKFLIFSNGGTMYNLQDYLLNYASWNTMLQIQNTTSTDLAYIQDMQEDKLYINVIDNPTMITIGYVPNFKDVNEIKSPYWTDMLLKLAVALTKITLGRIRTRYTQSNALWTQDGETMLEEGNNELNELREILRVNSQLVYPID